MTGGWVDRKAVPRGPNGRGLCRWCSLEVPRGRFTFSSAFCVHEWKLRSQPAYLREYVLLRDCGVCAGCGVDTIAAARKLRLFARRGTGKHCCSIGDLESACGEVSGTRTMSWQSPRVAENAILRTSAHSVCDAIAGYCRIASPPATGQGTTYTERMLDYEISPADAKALLAEKKARLIDVREPWEFEAARIPGSCPDAHGRRPRARTPGTRSGRATGRVMPSRPAFAQRHRLAAQPGLRAGAVAARRHRSLGRRSGSLRRPILSPATHGDGQARCWPILVLTAIIDSVLRGKSRCLLPPSTYARQHHPALFG